MRIAILVSALALGGCGVVFPYESTGSCPQIGQGTCASVRQVYAATNGADQANADAPATAPPAADAGAPAPGTAGAAGSLNGASAALVEASPLAASARVLPVTLAGDGALPLRTPAEIMRIWIAPWESDAGDLMMSGYVFTELQPRRWQVGSQPVAGPGRLRPVEPPPPSASPAPAGGGAPSRSATTTTPPVVAASAEVNRPVVGAGGPGGSPRGPDGAFWQTEPGRPPVQ